MSFKLNLILALLFISGFFNTSFLYSQDDLLQRKVETRFRNTSLKTAFRRIEQQLNCYFTFDGSTIDLNKIINQNFKGIPLEKCLNYMLEDTSLMYKTIDNHVLIKKKKAAVLKIAFKDSISAPLVIKGQVIDRSDNEPLAYASVSVSGKGLGAICNLQGEFILKIPGELLDEKISVSQMGYMNIIVPMEQFIDTFMVIKLERSYITIQEVIIRKTDPKALIRSAMNRIDKNYCVKPAYLTSFYRESVKKGSRYMFFSEAVLKLYKPSYSRIFDDDLLKVLKSRKMKDITQEDSVIIKLKSGLNTCTELDIVKNKIEFLDENNFEYYDYIMSDIVTYNDRNAYLIEFTQKKSVPEPLFEGKIYIDVEKLAIIGAEFSINPQKVGNAQNNFIVKKNRNVKIKFTDIDYLVNYRLVNDRYYLSYVKAALKIKVKKAGKIFPADFETSMEMAVNDIDTTDVERFKRNQTDNPFSIFSDDVHEYDESFWESYNFIKPEDPLQESIRELNFKIEELK